jgi:hypothetical protein
MQSSDPLDPRAVLGAVAAIFVLMKGRGALYEFLQWRLNEDWPQIVSVGPTIDRYAFQSALVAGIRRNET